MAVAPSLFIFLPDDAPLREKIHNQIKDDVAIATTQAIARQEAIIGEKIKETCGEKVHARAVDMVLGIIPLDPFFVRAVVVELHRAGALD